MTYALFGRFADRFDWHTPPHHYQDDHAFVLQRLGERGRVLDVGCGTGVFLRKAVAAGFDAVGIDTAPEMGVFRRICGQNGGLVVPRQTHSVRGCLPAPAAWG